MQLSFKEIWAVFSTGKGRIIGLDAIALSVPFRIAEKQLVGDNRGARLMFADFLKNEDISLGQLNDLVREIEANTKLAGTVVFNTDGSRRYENLADVGFMITASGFEIVVMTPSGVERA